VQNAAFFDIDGTLVKCQTQEILAKYLMREGVLSNFQILEISFWFMLYKMGLTNGSESLRKRAYRVFSKYPAIIIDSIFKKGIKEILQTQLRMNMKKCVDFHKNRNDYVFAVSASLEAFCVLVCAQFGIETQYSTRLLMRDGHYTGAWEGELLEGQAKVRLIRELAMKYQLELSQCVAYADSFSDIPMLEMIGCPIAVCPDLRLRKHALRKGWRIMSSIG